ncbi:MAG: hypothetical protein JNK37_00950 [Verrucomicrobiales bacterium]|nr:hypothetical protein [Verrucomicrobiales bacterium]
MKAILSLSLHLLCGLSLLSAEEAPVACEWVFSGGGGEHDKTRGVTFDRQGNVFLASESVGDAAFGNLTHRSAGGMDMCLVKLDPAGRPLWLGAFGGSLTDRAYGVATDAAGNAYVTGHYESTDATVNGAPVPNAGSYDIFTAKFSPDGLLLWVRTAGGPGYDYGHGICVDGQGDVIITGTAASGTTFGDQLLHGVFCAKYGADGSLRWVTATTGVSGSGHGIAVDAADHLYIGGNVSGRGAWGPVAIDSPSQAALAVKLTPDGTAVWASVIPGTPGALYHEITCDAAGRVWGVGMFKGRVTVAGETFESGGEKDNDGLIIHLDATGRPQWARHLHGAGTDYCLGIATDDHGTAYVCGDFNADTVLAGRPLTTRGSGDIFLAAFDPAGSLLWVEQMGGKLNDSAYPAAFRRPGELVIAGAFAAPAAFGSQTVTTSGKSDLYAAKWRLRSP